MVPGQTCGSGLRVGQDRDEREPWGKTRVSASTAALGYSIHITRAKKTTDYQARKGRERRTCDSGGKYARGRMKGRY